MLAYQRQHGVRFGEAAVALKLATQDDVMWALSKQFHYPYASGDGKRFDAELVAAIDPFNEQTESFRGIRSQLMMGAMAPDAPRRALAQLSPDAGDGKTFFAANLAIVFSQLGAKTLLIDADMRTPRQHRPVRHPQRARPEQRAVRPGRVEPGPPVADLPSPVRDAGRHAAAPNPLELLQRPAFSLLLQELLAKFDHVIVGHAGRRAWRRFPRAGRQVRRRDGRRPPQRQPDEDGEPARQRAGPQFGAIRGSRHQ